MAYSLTEQLSLDINWYFTDRWLRLCHVASAGSILPPVIAENDEKNNQFNEIVIKLPDRYKVVRNEKIMSLIQGINRENSESYFRDFELMAKRGLYAFDKFRLEDSEYPFYCLVAYPLYNPQVDAYPIEKSLLSLIPRTRVTINKRFLNPIELPKYLNKLYPRN
jgi:hypothetical protein